MSIRSVVQPETVAHFVAQSMYIRGSNKIGLNVHPGSPQLIDLPITRPLRGAARRIRSINMNDDTVGAVQSLCGVQTLKKPEIGFACEWMSANSKVIAVHCILVVWKRYGMCSEYAPRWKSEPHRFACPAIHANRESGRARCPGIL
jgi:hypothetical protein